MPSNPPQIVHAKPAITLQQHAQLLLGVNISTAVTVTSHTVPTPDFTLKNVVNYVGVRTVS